MPTLLVAANIDWRRSKLDRERGGLGTALGRGDNHAGGGRREIHIGRSDAVGVGQHMH